MSCNKKESELNANGYNCFFEQIDENMDGLIDDGERMIMNECMENSLNSISSIKNNLIGEWALIGHGEGWYPLFSKPCAYITITTNELTLEFQNGEIDTITTHTWDIEEVDSGSSNYFKLKIDQEFVEGLWITYFCENYMFGDGTPSDSNMYLYQKMN